MIFESWIVPEHHTYLKRTSLPPYRPTTAGGYLLCGASCSMEPRAGSSHDGISDFVSTVERHEMGGKNREIAISHLWHGG